MEPISQTFANELTNLVQKYYETEISNAEVVGVLHLMVSQLELKIHLKAFDQEKPY